jgi:hypothetical protein
VPTIESNADALLLAIPMVVILLAGLFRLDELVALPPKKPGRDRRLSGLDEGGRPIFRDPDGKRFDVPPKNS